MAIPFKKLGYKLNPITQDIETPQIFLVNKKLKKIGELCPVEDLNITINEVNQPDEVSFTYYKEVDDEACPCFDKLTDLSVIQVGNYGFFEIGIGKSENNSIVKMITGQSLGMAELSQINATLDVNTDDDLIRSDYDKNYPTVFYRDIQLDDDSEDIQKKKKESSLLDRILSYAPHYKVGYVDSTLRNIQRTFSWSDSDIVSILNDVSTEINCVFDIRVTINEDGEAERTVNAYDMQYCEHCWNELDEQGQKTNNTHTFRNIVNGVCQNCGFSKFIKDIGQDTNIFISTDYLSDEITIDGDKDSIKNCFKVVGGDDTVTATVQGLNMSANNRIMMFSDEQKKLMSPELVEKLETYDRDYAENSGDYERLLEIQYDLYDMILYLQSGKMPLLEEDIKETHEALYHVVDQITTYYKNHFYISTWENYGYSATRTSISNMFTTFMPKGFSFTIDTDGMEQTKNHEPAKQYKWYGSIKIYSTGNRDDYYTIHVGQTGETTVTHGKSETSFQFPDAEKQRKISNFSVTFNFADKNQDDYMNYIKQHTSYLLSEVDLTYDNEKAREWNQYSYNRLESYYDGFTTCIETIDGMPNERVTTDGENKILKQIKDNYTTIRNHIHEQMLVLRDQIFALSTYLGEFSNDFLDENDNPYHEFQYYSSVSEALSHMINPKYTGGYAVKPDGTIDTNNFTPNEFIGTKPCKCKKCSSINVSVVEEGVNTCNNCGSDDIYSYYDVMKDIVDSYTENQKENPNSSIVDMRKEIQAQFDVKTYFNDDSLYNELFSFIREDVYTNDNYRSDGLTNSQLISHAKELLAKATQELSKACVTQYTITAPVSAIVGQTAFEYRGVMVNDDYSGFMLNNYVRVRIDDDIYKMRIASIQFSFPIQDRINVTFTNVSHYNNGAMSDIASIVESAASMATSYNYVATQAEKGESANLQFDKIKNEGLDAGLMAVKAGQNQDVIIDNHGILIRKLIPETGEYSDEQMKFINRNMVLTDDNWRTARMAIGRGFYRSNPNEEPVPVYGVWADVLVGDLLVGKELIIKNDDGYGNSSVVIDKDGIDIKNGSIFIKNQNGCSVMIDPMYSLKENTDNKVFAIKNQKNEPIMNVNDKGVGFFKGDIITNNITAKGGQIGNWYIDGGWLRADESISDEAGISWNSKDRNTHFTLNGDNMEMTNIDTGKVKFRINAYSSVVNDPNSNCLIADVGNISLHSDGNMTLSANGHICVNSPIRLTNNRYILTDQSAGDSYLSLFGESNNWNIWIGHYNTDYGSQRTIYLNAGKAVSVGTFYTPDGSVSKSDKRIKDDITDISSSAVDFILGLKPSKYKLKHGTSGRYHFGFIAQDVNEIMQTTVGDIGLITKSQIGTTDDEDYVPVDFNNEDTYQYGLRYEEFIAPMVATIQSLNERIEKLENEIKKLKGE